MKKILLFIVSLYFYTSTFTQETTGFAIGPNISNRISVSEGSHIGYQAFGYVNIETYKKLSYQIQCKVQRNGYRVDEETMAVNYYASVPLLLKYTQPKSKVSLLFGVEPNFFIVSDYRPIDRLRNPKFIFSKHPFTTSFPYIQIFNGSRNQTESSYRYSFEEDFVGFDLSLGFQITRRFQHYFLANIGLTNNNFVVSYSIGI